MKRKRVRMLLVVNEELKQRIDEYVKKVPFIKKGAFVEFLLDYALRQGIPEKLHELLTRSEPSGEQELTRSEPSGKRKFVVDYSSID